MDALRAGIDSSGLSDHLKDLAQTRLLFASEYIDDNQRLQDLIRPGRLIIVDLRDEYIKKDEALGLFVVMLQIFSEATNSGLTPTPAKGAPKPPSVNAGFSFIDCAQKVLKEFGGKKLMHYKEITGKALEKGWLVTSGKTPEASMYAQVITEIKRQQKCGERPRFVQYGRGYIGLSQWMGRALAFQIE